MSLTLYDTYLWAVTCVIICNLPVSNSFLRDSMLLERSCNTLSACSLIPVNFDNTLSISLSTPLIDSMFDSRVLSAAKCTINVDYAVKTTRLDYVIDL